MTAPGYRLNEAAFEAAYKAYLDCPIDMCGDHDEECAKTVRAAIVAYLAAAPQPELPADLVERGEEEADQWSELSLSDRAILASQFSTFAREHAAAEKARADEADEALVALFDAAECIKHWHDAMKDGSGMVVSAEHVRALWSVTDSVRSSVAAIRTRKGGGDAPDQS